VWNLALDLVVEIYKLSHLLPGEEKYNLIGQMKQAVVSIPANIAEGAARKSKKEFAQFLHIAQGSLSELDTHLAVAMRLGYLAEDKVHNSDALMARVDKMLTGLIRSSSSPHA
jgi:four helix bundle protein